MNASRIPEGFAAAYAGLVDLVDRLQSGEVGERRVAREVDAYRREDCHGAQTLAQAAALAFRYHLATTGLEGRSQTVTGRMAALDTIEKVLNPPHHDGGEDERGAGIVEVALPEGLRQRMPKARGFGMGRIQILFEPTEGPPHAHLSVSHPDRYPSWEELLRARDALEGPPPNLFAWVPKPKETATGNPKTVHLYILPPEELLG